MRDALKVHAKYQTTSIHSNCWLCTESTRKNKNNIQCNMKINEINSQYFHGNSLSIGMFQRVCMEDENDGIKMNKQNKK